MAVSWSRIALVLAAAVVFPATAQVACPGTGAGAIAGAGEALFSGSLGGNVATVGALSLVRLFGSRVLSSLSHFRSHFLVVLFYPFFPVFFSSFALLSSHKRISNRLYAQRPRT
jgi:hypothetical protein